jgi:hypothetical protein
MIACGEPIKRLVSDTIRLVAEHEKHTGARQRARRPDDERHHVGRIETIVCNLAYAVLLPPETGRIAVRLGHGAKGKSRYDNPALGKPLSSLINTLDDLDCLHARAPLAIRGEVSSIAPSAWLATKVAEHNITLSDFGRH